MNTFKHSGDLGDIIYSLYAIKKLGGGILYLDTTGGENDIACIRQCIDKKTKFNSNSFEYIKPLIEAQEYISAVKVWNGEDCKYNLNNFRLNYVTGACNTENLIDNQLEALNLPLYTDHNELWLVVDEKIKLPKKTIITRTPRYQSNFGWFQANKFNFRDRSIFVGLPKEHEYFEWTFDIKIPFYPVKDAYEMAAVLNGCTALVTNQTSTLALAIGLGNVPIVQEVDPKVPNCTFKNKRNMTYI